MTSWAWHFTEERTAAAVHACSLCSNPIGRGDQYKRTAIPPWGYEDEVGGRYSTGEWLIIKACTEHGTHREDVYT